MKSPRLKRETREETGLNVTKLHPKFKTIAKYHMKKNWETGEQYTKPKLKAVAYFLGESPSKIIKIYTNIFKCVFFERTKKPLRARTTVDQGF